MRNRLPHPHHDHGVGCTALVVVHEAPPDKLVDDREKARRCMIYRDMSERLGRIDFRQLQSWPYQPAEAEVDAELREVQELYRRSRPPEKQTPPSA